MARSRRADTLEWPRSLGPGPLMHESLDHDHSVAGVPRLVPAVPVADDEVRDRALIARVAAGDELAFEQLVRLHRPRLLRIAERVVDAGRAEDAVQVALLRAYQSFSSGEIPRQPAAWLSAITRNAAIDQQRRRGPVDPVAEPESGSSAPSVASVAESRAELREVLRDVAALPEHEREAILMRAATGAGHEAIGAHLSVSPGQARQLLHRARRRLREVAAVLLPAWLAFRMTQARAAAASLAAAPSETVLSTKGAALAIAAAATIGGGGAAVQATREAQTPTAPQTTSSPVKDAATLPAAGAAGASSSTAPRTTGTATAAAPASPRSGEAREGGDDRSTASERSRGRDASAAPGVAGAAPQAPVGAPSTGAEDDDRDRSSDDRRPARHDDSPGSGSAKDDARGDDRDRDREASNSGSGKAREDDRDDDREAADSSTSSGSSGGSGSSSGSDDVKASGGSGASSGSESSGGSSSPKPEDSDRTEDRQRDKPEDSDERSGRLTDAE